jgi:TolA-binding protein
MTQTVYLVLFLSLAFAIVFASWSVSRNLSASRQAKAQLDSGGQYRGLADEYRRLSDLAITAQEHTDLRLTDISVRIDELRDQLEQMQRILKEVE